MYWDKTQEQELPGIYLYLNRTVERVIRAGANGIVAMVATSSVTEAKGKVHEITKPREIVAALGTSKQHAELAMQGGARKLIIYVLGEAETLGDGLDALAPYYFDVFALGYDAEKADVDAMKSWRASMIREGRHFVGLAGSTYGQADVAAIKAIYAAAKDNDLAYVGFGGVDNGGNEYSGGQIAAYLAGVQGSRGLAEGSLTRFAVPFLVDVEHRLSKAQRTELKDAGIIALLHNGQEIVVDQAITSDATGFAKGKLRIAYNAAVYQETLNFALENEFIGKINNDEAGQASLLAAVNEFNDRLVDARVLTPGTETKLHPDFESVGDEVFLMTRGEFIDAVERIYFEFVAQQTQASQGGAA